MKPSSSSSSSLSSSLSSAKNSKAMSSKSTSTCGNHTDDNETQMEVHVLHCTARCPEKVLRSYHSTPLPCACLLTETPKLWFLPLPLETVPHVTIHTFRFPLPPCFLVYAPPHRDANPLTPISTLHHETPSRQPINPFLPSMPLTAMPMSSSHTTTRRPLASLAPPRPLLPAPREDCCRCRCGHVRAQPGSRRDNRLSEQQQVQDSHYVSYKAQCVQILNVWARRNRKQRIPRMRKILCPVPASPASARNTVGL